MHTALTPPHTPLPTQTIPTRNPVCRAFLDQRASCSRSLYTSDEVQATHYTLVDGTQLVLKVTSKDRAEFEWNQVGGGGRVGMF